MEKEIVLVGSARSTCTHRVRLVLHAKRLCWTERQLSLERDEQVDPTILALNPDGLVPILIHGQEVVTESAVINEYVDEVFPDFPLRPDRAIERARMRAWVAYFDEVTMTAVRYLSFQHFYLPVIRRRNAKERAAFAERLPRRKGFWLEMTDAGFSPERLALETERARQTLARLDDQLRVTPWLVGEHPTLADYAVLPAIVRLEDMSVPWLFGGRPHLSAWYARARQRREFQSTYGPGTRFKEGS